MTPEIKALLAAADALAAILEAAIHEHDTADHEWSGNENPWLMREWFDDTEREALDRYRAAREAITKSTPPAFATSA